MSKDRALFLLRQFVAFATLFLSGHPRIAQALAVLQAILDKWDQVWSIVNSHPTMSPSASTPNTDPFDRLFGTLPN